MTRLQEFAERVTIAMLEVATGRLRTVANEAARTVLEREVRAFVRSIPTLLPPPSERDEWLDSPTPTRSAETADPDPYCELAASEIPGFGTRRDRHFCAKLHRDKPLPKPVEAPTERNPPAPRCADWCGSEEGPMEQMVFSTNRRDYCSPACRNAGRPIHPRDHR